MSLPKTPTSSAFFKKKNIEAIVLPVAILAVFGVVLFIGVVLPKQDQPKKQSQSDTLAVTKPTTIKDASGKTITVPPEVQQLSVDRLKSFLDNKEEILLVQITSDEGFNVEYIKGSIFINEKSTTNSLNSLSLTTKHVFISQDGSKSALAMADLINLGLPRDKNFNLEGGLAAWKKKGYAIEK